MKEFPRIGARSAVALGGVAVLFGLVLYLIPAHNTSSALAMAESVREECRDSGEKEACYERLVPSLYPKVELQTVFQVIRELRRLDPSYQFCHVLAHGLGERIVAEDPEKWIDAIPLNPSDGMCSNGFIHGVVGGKFRSEVLDDATIESLIPDFSRACETRPSWHPSDLDKAICYHGLGHLYDYITDANIPKALDICAKTTGAQYRRVCIEGVFMQIYQPLEPDDFELIKRMTVSPTKDTVRSFCASFEKPEFVGACLRESWPFFDDEVRSGTGVAAFCSGQPDAAEEKKCFESATAIIGRMTLGNPDAAASACGRLPIGEQLTCFVTVARASIEEDRDAGKDAVALCNKAMPETARACMQALAEQASFVYGEDTVRKKSFCAELPSSFRDICNR